MKNTMKKPVNIPVSKLRPFEGHPFKVKDDEEMNTLIESVQTVGILSPLIVRPIENTEECEVISGHRRLHASVKAGIKEVPALIYAINRDEAAVMLVDSNLHREHILPSEKAFSYKLKAEALNHQGRTSGQFVPKSDANRTTAEIGESTGESYKTVQRYIRLTNLIPELLDLMDEGKIAFSVGVELSYLDDQLQYDLLNEIELNDCTPSYAQSVRMHKAYNADVLNKDGIEVIMSEVKANQKEKVSFQVDDIRRYFPKSYTTQDIQKTIMRLIEKEYERKQRQRDAR